METNTCMTNLKFKAIRKCCGYDWESYKDTRSDNFIAICHLISQSVESNTWDGLWEEIIGKSKEYRKSQKNKRFKAK